MLSKTLDERFWEKVDVRDPDDCWGWTACKSNHGYGAFRKAGQTVQAHRLSWELCHGQEIPGGLCVLHKCDNPLCVNPDHLELGTRADNSRQMIERGRCRPPDRRGEKHPLAKLTADDVRIIREYKGTGIRQWQVAKIYGIASQTVSNIWVGRRWKHLLAVKGEGE